MLFLFNEMQISGGVFCNLAKKSEQKVLLNITCNKYKLKNNDLFHKFVLKKNLTKHFILLHVKIKQLNPAKQDNMSTCPLQGFRTLDRGTREEKKKTDRGLGMRSRIKCCRCEIAAIFLCKITMSSFLAAVSVRNLICPEAH